MMTEERSQTQLSDKRSEKREHSSVGLEHLPYKQRVGGSTPSAPTKSLGNFQGFFRMPFFYFITVLTQQNRDTNRLHDSVERKGTRSQQQGW